MAKTPPRNNGATPAIAFGDNLWLAADYSGERLKYDDFEQHGAPLGDGRGANPRNPALGASRDD